MSQNVVLCHIKMCDMIKLAGKIEAENASIFFAQIQPLGFLSLYVSQGIPLREE